MYCIRTHPLMNYEYLYQLVEITTIVFETDYLLITDHIIGTSRTRLAGLSNHNIGYMPALVVLVYNNKCNGVYSIWWVYPSISYGGVYMELMIWSDTLIRTHHYLWIVNNMIIIKVQDEYCVIGRGLFKRETNIQTFVGLTITLSTG